MDDKIFLYAYERLKDKNISPWEKKILRKAILVYIKLWTDLF